MRTGHTVTINNDLGHIVSLTRWDNDELTIEVEGEGNVVSIELSFGIAGRIEELHQLFKPEMPF